GRMVEEIGPRVLYASVFAAGHRVAADEGHALRQRLARHSADFDLSTPGVGDGRARPDLLRFGPQEIDDPTDGRGQIDQIGLANLAALEALFYGVDDSAFDSHARRTRSAARGDPPRESGPPPRERGRPAAPTAAH